MLFFPFLDIATTKCPALDGNSWIYPSCTAQASNVGSVCKALSCTSEQGPEEKLCQSNGTWTPLGGRFCPPGKHIFLCLVPNQCDTLFPSSLSKHQKSRPKGTIYLKLMAEICMNNEITKYNTVIYNYPKSSI